MQMGDGKWEGGSSTSRGRTAAAAAVRVLVDRNEQKGLHNHDYVLCTRERRTRKLKLGKITYYCGFAAKPIERRKSKRGNTKLAAAGRKEVTKTD
jgi:hypothetical protein